MLRVLHIVTYMGRGGLETMLMNYYRQIDRSQVQFDFLTHRQERFDYDNEIEQLGGKIYHLPVLNPFSKHYKFVLGKFFDNHSEYQIIHVHQDCLSSVILKVAKKHGVKVRIAHSHNSSQDKNLKYFIKIYYRKFIPKYATHLMACGKRAGDWMFRGASYQILNNAIDVRTYIFDNDKKNKMRTELGVTENTLLVGHVGRFCEPKNHCFLVDIFENLCKLEPESKLLLVGDGELRDNIEKKVEKLGLQDKVIFTGIRSDVADLMQAMDVFVFPSVYEGVPLTLIEAQASGLPCLISDKVPIECKKTDLVNQIALRAGSYVWAQKVIEAATVKRRNTYDEIRKEGFDIAENARWLMEFYQSLLR